MKFFITKTFALVALFLLLQIPLSWIKQTINERSYYKQQAISGAFEGRASAQRLVGPIMTIPYTRTYWSEKTNDDGSKSREQLIETHELTLLPEELNIVIQSEVSERKKGIFPIPIYNNDFTVSGSFSKIDLEKLKSSKEDIIELNHPFISLSLLNQRGISSIKNITINNQDLKFLPGSNIDLQEKNGVHAIINNEIPLLDNSFSFNITLIGSQSYTIIPIGKENKLNISSNWPHPQFIGSQLPDTSDITDQGFTAKWQTNHLATNIDSAWQECRINHCSQFLAQEVGVSVFQSVDIYQQAIRAIKYGILFLLITFITFWLYEVMCKLNIHPVQYGFVGLALAMFFILLLSFSEHLGFAKSYWIAASSCILLLGIYIHAILKRWIRTGFFVSLLIGLYATIYVILQLEDTALLMGSLLLFSLLATAMLITRNIDWYSWQNQITQKQPN